MKEVALKKCCKKYFTQLYISRYPFIPTNLLLAAMSFFFSFFFQNTVRLFPKRLNTEKKKLHQMCYCDIRALQTKSTMYKQCKQNSRNFAKKVLVIKLDPPKDFDKSTRLFNMRRSFSEIASQQASIMDPTITVIAPIYRSMLPSNWHKN